MTKPQNTKRKRQGTNTKINVATSKAIFGKYIEYSNINYIESESRKSEKESLKTAEQKEPSISPSVGNVNYFKISYSGYRYDSKYR